MAVIILVDDLPANREYLATLLKYQGHQVLEASDGSEALILIAEALPDLLITDILMPSMDGYELVRQIRENPATENLLVIFYTAYYHGAEAIKLAETCGVRYVLAKPCEPEHVLHIVELALNAPPEQRLTNQPGFDETHISWITNELSSTVDELQATNERLAALIDLGLHLASETDLDVLLQKVCVGARSLIGSKFAAIMVRSAESGLTAYFKVTGMPAEVAADLAHPEPDNYLRDKVSQKRSSFRTNTPLPDPERLGLPVNFPPMNSALFAPVISPAKEYGWLCLSDKVGANEFNENDEKLMTILASQVGRIYESGSLYREIQRHAAQIQLELTERKAAEAKVKRLNRVYAVLSGINSLIVRVRSRDDLFKNACEIATNAGGFGLAWIGLLDSDSFRIDLQAWSGGNQAFIEALSKELMAEGPFAAFILNKVILEQEIVVLSNLEQQKLAFLHRDTTSLGFLAVCLLPMVVEHQTIGLVALYSIVREQFDQAERVLLTELANDIGFAVDHLENKQKLSFMAYFDPLTGLANDTLFKERLIQYVDSEGDGHRIFALIFLDIDHFKSLRDSHDTHFMRTLIKQMSQRLLGKVGNATAMAVLGEDRFGIVLLGISTEDDTARWIEQCAVECFEQPYTIDDISIRVSMRAGISIFPKDGAEPDDLIRQSESALLRARVLNEPYQFYSQTSMDRIMDKIAMERNLTKALQQGEFILHYQPKLDLNSEAIIGVEALIRWNHPEHGLVMPMDFISTLEESGLIVEVGEWILKEVTALDRRWRATVDNCPRIAFNVSAKQLYQTNVVEKFAAIIGGSPHGLEMEITESYSMDDISKGMATLVKLREIGLSIAIDDFGTGYSSLSYLSRLPIDTIKIDRSFVIAMNRNPATLTLVTTIISMAKALNLKVIAEGVETAEQLQLLRDLKCDQVQGYFLSRPLPAAEVETFLAAWSRQPWPSLKF